MTKDVDQWIEEAYLLTLFRFGPAYENAQGEYERLRDAFLRNAPDAARRIYRRLNDAQPPRVQDLRQHFGYFMRAYDFNDVV